MAKFLVGLFMVFSFIGLSHASVFSKKIYMESEPGRAKTIVYLPKRIGSNEKLPLILSLHGYRGNPQFQRFTLPLNYLATKKRTIVVAPSGIKDDLGRRFWNGLNCCSYAAKEKRDDVKFLRELVKELSKRYPVDKKRIYIAGYSNGGFMAYRMACEASDLVRGIVNFAGSGPIPQLECNPINPVKVLHIHGTDDEVIKYQGSEPSKDGPFQGLPWHPSALESVNRFADLNSCKGKIVERSDSFKTTFRKKVDQTIFTGCKKGGDVELWTIKKAKHFNYLGKKEIKRIFNFLF